MSRQAALARISHVPAGELLLKNLRLLDFDEEFDWPQVTSKTFAATDSVRNLTKRAYAAGWILYKLFELFEPKETKAVSTALAFFLWLGLLMPLLQNMGVYFPPFESKQSSSLRAALFKRLNDLKNDGFFGKDVVVRRTMFEDCKGPKFEELLMIFSTAVLLKVVEGNSSDRSITKKLLNKPLFDQDLCHSLLLAYKVSIDSRLRDRDALSRRWHKFGRSLLAKGQELDRRAAAIEQTIQSDPQKKVPQRTMERLRRHLKDSWKGDPEWVEIILRGDQHRPRKTLLDRPFSDVWNYACNDTLYAVHPEGNDSLLQILEDRVHEQRSRLDRWRSIHHDLQASVCRRGPEKDPSGDSMHQGDKSYALCSQTTVDTNTPFAKASRPRTTSSPIAEGENLPLFSARRKAGHVRAQSEAVSTPFSLKKQDRMTERPLPNTSARMAKHSSRPKIPGQYESQEGSVAPDYAIYETSTQFCRTSSYDDSYLDTSNEFHGYQQAEQSGGRSHPVDDIVNSVINAEPSPAKPLLSLAERTRMSMATMSTARDEAYGTTLAHAYPRPTPLRYNSSESAVQTPTPLPDLAERTRQSILFTAVSTKALEKRRTSNAQASTMHALSQFQTPVRATANPLPSSASAFDEADLDADYETIFKSRPRVALSPILQPTLETRESFGSAMAIDNETSYEDDFS